MAAVEYFYVGSAKPKAKAGSDIFKQLPQPKAGQGKFNPFFNFDQEFIDSLQSLKNIDIASSIPYVSVKIINYSGEVVDDLNLEYFHKTVDYDSVGKGGRYADRPIMSLKDLQISTDLASGYLYYTNIVLTIKVHSPEEIGKSRTLLALLMPGMPLELGYGWTTPGDNALSISRETLKFQVVSYNISISTTGEAEITVEGKALNETFNNVYLGDTDPFIQPTSHDWSLARTLEDSQKKITYLEKLAKTEGRNDYDIIQTDLKETRSREAATRGDISENFTKLLQKLRGKKNKFVEGQLFGPKDKQNKLNVIRFHDIIFNLCNDSFSGIVELFPGIEKVSVVYGNFNDNAEILWSAPESPSKIEKSRSIADFPIYRREFMNLIRQASGNGQYVLKVSDLFNMLIGNFMENSEYWIGTIGHPTDFTLPEVVVNTTTTEKELLIHIVDIKSGIPLTTSKFPKKSSPEKTLEKEFIDLGVPIIRLGHGSSFVKNISFSHIMDQHMKATLIERMSRDRFRDPRSFLLSRETLNNSEPVTTPLTLPLKGTAELLGHTLWKPFRTIFFSTGIYFIDAAYKITSVTHHLGARGFTTNIEFLYH